MIAGYDPRTPPQYGEGDRSAQTSGRTIFSTTRPTIERTCEERRNGHLSEVVLWRALRTRPGGFKFCRQHPIGPYILDFACLATRLAIEIDRDAHSRAGRPSLDDARITDIAARGFHTPRIPARLILPDLDAGVRGIVQAGDRRISPPPSHRDGPPPRPGEVFFMDAAP